MLLNFQSSRLKSSLSFAPSDSHYLTNVLFHFESKYWLVRNSVHDERARRDQRAECHPWNEIIIVSFFPSRGFISGSLSFRASRTNSLFSSSRSRSLVKFHVSCNLSPPTSSRYLAAAASTIEISGAEIELETRVNEHYTAAIDQVWPWWWSKRKVAIENKFRGVGRGRGRSCSTQLRIIVRVTDKLTPRGEEREGGREAVQRRLITELGRPSRSFGHLVSGNEGTLFPMHREARGWRAHITLLLRSTWIGTYRDRHS